LGDKIWAVGGKDSNDATPSKIEAFDPTTKYWAELHQQLQSTNMSELVVSQIPSSALDCVSPCQCGKVKEQRIFNGIEAQPNAFPWIAELALDIDIDDGYINSKCAATLIGNRFALTAAHCLYHEQQLLPANSFSIELNLHNRRDTEARKEYQVSRLLVHEDYYIGGVNDIALLKLKNQVDLSIYNPICLPDIDANFVGKTGHIFGWGDTGHFSADKLQTTEVDILESSECEGQLNADEEEALIVCAGRKGTGPCKGDSGGPLTIVDDGGFHTLIGVVSKRTFAFNCDGDQGPAVYSNVQAFTSWIASTIKENGGMASCNFTFSAPPRIGT